MPTLRLIEPNGYSVPGGLRTVTPDTEAQARTELEALAVQEAAQWADFGYHPGDYRILTDPAS
ncbi:hypothetical protein [Streptomyces sp. NPDC048521]|uniref:hypothetical protein n=1 Tax=Streptomyces sp. NPDC048521 TaxID=3365566 RepID=UPI00371C09EF